MKKTNQEAEYIDHMGNDLSVVRAARVSFAADKGVKWSESDAKLIKYLANHNHWTPFAHTAITLRMKAPVPIRTQCFKHKVGLSENEESRRYISGRPEYFMPKWRKSVSNKKQGSGDCFLTGDSLILDKMYEDSIQSSILAYEKALHLGVCEEQARFYLPQGCVVNWYWTGSLAAFARFAKQRMDSHAQVEIQELATMVSDIIKPLYPVSWEALTGG